MIVEKVVETSIFLPILRGFFLAYVVYVPYFGRDDSLVTASVAGKTFIILEVLFYL